MVGTAYAGSNIVEAETGFNPIKDTIYGGNDELFEEHQQILDTINTTTVIAGTVGTIEKVAQTPTQSTKHNHGNGGQNNQSSGSGVESGIKTVNGYDAKVNVGQQNKHILGTNEYKNAINNGQTKSILYGDTNDIQNLLNQKAGTGDFIGTNKERVNFGKVIGQYIDPNTGIGAETTMGIIHYGKKGAHIVPARPN